MGIVGLSLRALGRFSEAIEALEHSLTIARDIQDWNLVPANLGTLSLLHLTLGNIDEAGRAAREALDFAPHSPNANELIHSRTNLARILHQLGATAEALELFQQAETQQRKLDPSIGILYSLSGFWYCNQLLDEGRSDEVLDRARQTLTWAFDRKWMLETALDNLTPGRAYPSGSSEAAFHLDRAVEGLRRYGSVDRLPADLLARAANFRHAREFDRAQADLDEARTVAERFGMRLHLTDCALEQACIYLAQGQPDLARPYYENAKQLAGNIKYGRRTPVLAELRRQLT